MARFVGGRRENVWVTESPSAAAQRLLVQAADALLEAAGSSSDAELVALLGTCESVVRRLDRVTVDAVAALDRRGVFAEHGYRSAVQALSDLLGWERFEARRRVTAAEQVTPRTGLDGSVQPARLPATAAVFAAGRTGLRQVEVIARVLGSKPAGRLSPQVWAGAEAQLAGKADVYTPHELHEWGTALVELLDQDGEQPDDRAPARVNELLLTRLPDGGGKVKGRFDDAAMFEAIAAVIDAHARPLTAEDDRSTAERQAEALADVCGYVLDHARRRCCRTRVGTARTSMCWSGWRTSKAGRGPGVWTSVARSRRSRCGCCAATPRWCRSCSTARDSRSTSAGPPAPSRTGSAGRWPPGTADAHTPAAGARLPGAKSTT